MELIGEITSWTIYFVAFRHAQVFMNYYLTFMNIVFITKSRKPVIFNYIYQRKRTISNFDRGNKKLRRNGRFFDRTEWDQKIPIQAEATPKLRIGICEASVASIHKLPFLRSFLLPLSKLIFSCKQFLGSILPWYLCLKICGKLHIPKKIMQKGTPKISFQGVFLPKVVLSQKRSFQLKSIISNHFAEN